MTKPKIVYIAHPVSGDVGGNMHKLRIIYKRICTEYFGVIVPIAPYYLSCHALDDNNPDERLKGIYNNNAILSSGIVSEVWLFGDRVSKGMLDEIRLAQSLDIPIKPMTKETIIEYDRLSKK